MLDPRNTHEKKSLTHEIPTGENFGPTKYPRDKILDPRNTHEKKFETHEIATRKVFGPTKARWHGDTSPTRPMMARDSRNLAHSFFVISWSGLKMIFPTVPKFLCFEKKKIFTMTSWSCNTVAIRKKVSGHLIYFRPYKIAIRWESKHSGKC